MEPVPTPERITDMSDLAPRPSRFSKKTVARIALIAGLLLALLMSVVGYLSTRAMPGDALYGFKTSIVEQVTNATKLTPEARAKEATDLLTVRLRELQALAADNASSSPETLAALADLTTRHANQLTDAIATAESLDTERRITTLAEGSATLRAIEVLIEDTPEFASIRKQVSEGEGRAEDTLRGIVTAYATTGDSNTVSIFIGNRIVGVGEGLETVAAGSRAQQIAFRRVAETNEAIAQGDLGNALFFIIKAEEAMLVDRLLYDTERGIGDNLPTADPSQIPEGS